MAEESSGHRHLPQQDISADDVGGTICPSADEEPTEQRIRRQGSRPMTSSRGENDDETLSGEVGAGGEGVQPSEAATTPPGEQGEGDEEDEELPYPDFQPVVFRCVKQTTRPRGWCLRVITWPYPFLYHTCQFISLLSLCI